MAGYTGEKRWRDRMNPDAPDSGVSELTKAVCVQMIDALTEAEAAYAELLELYQYAGSTIQGLADLLFTEDIRQRTSPGTNAVITVDVPAFVGSPQVANTSITAVAIDTAGTGYADGNYQLQNVQAPIPGGGVINYTVSGGSVTSVSLAAGGENYTPGTGKVVINFPLAGDVSETTANAEEVAKTQAAFDAITALHELYQAADNQIVAQEDRLAQIRRMT